MLLKKHFWLLSMLKTVVLHNIFVETVIILFFRILWWIESSKEHLFEIESFCNIINIFTVTFDQFNASLMNKSINFLEKKMDVTDYISPKVSRTGGWIWIIPALFWCSLFSSQIWDLGVLGFVFHYSGVTLKRWTD